MPLPSAAVPMVPGMAVLLVVLGTNLLGDGLRYRLDPRRLKVVR